jgi:hypothetical protein
VTYREGRRGTGSLNEYVAWHYQTSRCIKTYTYLGASVYKTQIFVQDVCLQYSDQLLMALMLALCM